jgi:hypothetical protein
VPAEEEKEEEVVEVTHFSKVASMVEHYGNPVRVGLRKGETVKEFKQRLCRQFNENPLHYDKVRIAIMKWRQPSFLDDGSPFFFFFFNFFHCSSFFFWLELQRV